MPIPPTARKVGPKPKNPLTEALDNMPVYDGGEETFDEDYSQGTYYTEAVWGEFNHIPGNITYAQRRNPGREYVWERDGEGHRIWRTK